MATGDGQQVVEEAVLEAGHLVLRLWLGHDEALGR